MVYITQLKMNQGVSRSEREIEREEYEQEQEKVRVQERARAIAHPMVELLAARTSSYDSEACAAKARCHF